ncbi:hypothetical protein ACWCPQ_32275 [Nocardia sp. NPDC001965]
MVADIGAHTRRRLPQQVTKHISGEPVVTDSLGRSLFRLHQHRQRRDVLLTLHAGAGDFDEVTAATWHGDDAVNVYRAGRAQRFAWLAQFDAESCCVRRHYRLGEAGLYMLIGRAGWSPMMRPVGFARIATALMNTDPEQANQLIDHAETLTSFISDLWDPMGTVTRIAAVLAGIDPDRAETLAHTITDPAERVLAVMRIAAVVAAVEPERALTFQQTLTRHAQRPQATEFSEPEMNRHGFGTGFRFQTSAGRRGDS